METNSDFFIIESEPTDKSLKRIEFLKNLPKNSKIHISGVCGTGMAGVLQLFKNSGFWVSGSDKAFYPPMGDVVKKYCDKIYVGYAAENINEEIDLIVIGNALSKSNPEVEKIAVLKKPYACMPEVFAALLIGDYSNCKNSVVVTGTHGKTTTSSMITVMLEQAQLKPGFFIGGVVPDLPGSLRGVTFDIPLEKRVVVLEGDEYDSCFYAKYPKFLSYRPDITIATSVEFDHADIYRNVEEIKERFAKLIEITTQAFIYWEDSPELVAVVKQSSHKNLISYGTSETAKLKLIRREVLKNEGQRLLVNLFGRELELTTKLSGLYNALNLLASAGVGALLGLSDSEIQKGLASFSGALRRQTEIFKQGGIVVIEDFAHHPTAIGVTLTGIKERFPNSRLFGVYEPRSNTSRKAIFQEDYIKCFDAAEIVCILQPTVSTYQGLAGTEKELDLNVLAAELNLKGKEIQIFENTEQILAFLLADLRSGDVCVLMSNGDFGGLPKKLSDNLRERV